MADKKITDLTGYTTPLDADVVPVVDVANDTTKKTTWSNIKATLKTYFDTLYTYTIPVKATGAEINTGTDDAKFATPKAIADSNIAFLSDIPTVPSKATGTDVDTGTDDTKYLTVKAINDSHNVPMVAPGTSGNVLTSDGTDWVSSAPTSTGFDPFAGNLIQIDWSASSWSEFGSGGSITYRKASADFTSDGGGTSSRFAYIGSTAGNPLQALVTTGKVTTIQFSLLQVSELNASHTIYFRVENAGTETANPPSSTVRHYGFSINNGNVTCSNADGTTATTTGSGTISAGESLNVFKMVITYGTNVKFYKNGTLLATHTTNLPSATTYRIMTGFVNSDTTSRNYDIGQTTIFSAY